MGAVSKIEWTDHTFNAWTGCTKVSAACDHCYAEGWAKRSGAPELWQGKRRRTTPTYWKQPLKWNMEAKRAAIRHKVFCCSLADVFDNHVPVRWRQDLWDVIENTPHLDWLLLTKRPQNIAKMLPGPSPFRYAPWPWPNVWLGTTVENQTEADRRIPHLLAVPAAVRFLSCEPLLGKVNLDETRSKNDEGGDWRNVLECGHDGHLPSIDWVICGGESGPGRRAMDLAWARSLRDQCAAAGVAFFGKQWDKVQPLPADLMVREFPAFRP